MCRNPLAYVDLERCDHCLRDFEEHEITEYRPRYWTCKDCADELRADEDRELEAAE